MAAMSLSRRPFLQRAALLLGAAALPPSAWARMAAASSPEASAAPIAPTARLAAAWRARSAGADAANTTDYVGVLHLDWAAGQVRIAQATPVQGRAHGLLAEAGGGFLAIASRPGRWLMRLDAQGKLVQQHWLDQETPARSFDGHIMASNDGQWLYTTETDRNSGQGWVSVRDARTLAKVAQWATQGMDPHQLLRDTQGMLVVANGGIPRTAKGEKRDLHLMAPSLVRLNPANGELLGQWRLADPRLSIRHLAWSTGEQPLLGVALQAEHDDIDQRRARAGTVGRQGAAHPHAHRHGGRLRRRHCPGAGRRLCDQRPARGPGRAVAPRRARHPDDDCRAARGLRAQPPALDRPARRRAAGRSARCGLVAPAPGPGHAGLATGDVARQPLDCAEHLSFGDAASEWLHMASSARESRKWWPAVLMSLVAAGYCTIIVMVVAEKMHR